MTYNSMAFDLFEVESGKFLVNELQTHFGHVQDHIMEVDGKPGRYILQQDKWVFDDGSFNTNATYDLRLRSAIGIYLSKQEKTHAF